MRAPSCPTCQALHQLLVAAEPDVGRRGVTARARGPGWGVLVALPEELGAETEEEAAELEAARERGYYVGVMPIHALTKMVPERGHPPDAVAGILRQLARAAPPKGRSTSSVCSTAAWPPSPRAPTPSSLRRVIARLPPRISAPR